MNVTCTGCPAKYAVPDEKVRGKKVRITCKHCGTNIVVDGTADMNDALPSKPDSSPAASAKASAANTSGAAAKVATAKEPAQAKSPAGPAEVMFIVGFADDRQHPHTISQIVELYGAGKIDHETLVWKDGMDDWLSPFDVPELAAAIRAKNPAPQAVAPAFAPIAEDEATLVVRSPLEDAELAAAIAAGKAAKAAAKAPAPAPAAVPEPAPTAAAATAATDEPAQESMFGKPAAARRVEKRAGAVDLFGGVADAGSEGDVSLDLGPSDEPAHKMTGARNESSVLFSLDALTKPDPKVSKAKERARDEEASALFGESAPDSLMSLGSGGLGAMAAPDFTKPVSATAQTVALNGASEGADGPSNKGRGGVVLLVGFLGIAAAAALAFVMMKKQPMTDPVAPSTVAQATASTTPNPSEAPAPSATGAASATDAVSATGAASATAAASATTAASASGASSANTTGAAATGTASAPSSKPPAAGLPAAPATPAAAVNKSAEPVAASKPSEPAATPEAAAFDKNAAVAALGAAAASAASCKQADGPTGSGKVSVTFAPSGRATATSVAGELAGTEVGGCVARLFRAAKVPPFTGEPVTVSKSFSIQ